MKYKIYNLPSHRYPLFLTMKNGEVHQYWMDEEGLTVERAYDYAYSVNWLDRGERNSPYVKAYENSLGIKFVPKNKRLA